MKKTAVLVLLATFVALPVAAQKPLHFMASQTLSYDDNIYLTDKNTKDSMISTTRVGADYKANIPSTGLQLNADAGVGYNAYTEKHNKNNYRKDKVVKKLTYESGNVGARSKCNY